MARTARIKSKTNIYHVMLRGNNKQQIFLDEEDSSRFLEIVRKYKDICNFKIFAYCLMGNHVHILVKTDDISLDSIMKRVVVKFVYYYNVKYSRIGHLFQDRYKSEPVETDEYFLQVIRYIHQNPIKAGICEKMKEYKYSSYNDNLTEGRFSCHDEGRQ